MVHGLISKTCSVINSFNELQNWVSETEYILHILKEDLEVSTGTNKLHLAYVIDYFDICDFAFPFGTSESELTTKLYKVSKEEKKKINFIAEQSARSTLFYKLKEESYPLMLVWPYYLELYTGAYMRFPESIPLPNYSQVINDIKELIPDLERWLNEYDRISQDPDRLLDQRTEILTNELYDAFVQKAPDLLYTIAVLQTKRPRLLKKIVPKQVSASSDKWPIIKNIIDTEERSRVKRLARINEAQEVWLDCYNKVRKGDKWTNQNRLDAIALTITKDLNKNLNKNGWLVLFVSSAASTKKVVELGSQLGRLRFKYKNRYINTSILRNIESFKHLNRYQLKLKSLGKEETPQLLITAIDNDLRQLQPLLRKKYIQSKKRLEKLIQQSADIDKKAEQKHEEAIKILQKFINNAKKLREKLASAHVILDSSAYLQPYDHLMLLEGIPHDIEEPLEKIKHFESVISKIVDILRSPINYVEEVFKRLAYLKFDLFSELLVIQSTSKFATTLVDKIGADQLIRFVRFPFHLDFSNNLLVDDIKELRYLFRPSSKKPNWQQVGKHLQNMSRKTSNGEYWTSEKSTSLGGGISKNPERLLLLYAFMYGFGRNDLVLDGINSVLHPDSQILDSYVNDKSAISRLRHNFERMQFLSRIELATQKDLDSDNPIEVRSVLNDYNISDDTIENDSRLFENLDPRILFSAGFWAGFGGRKKRMPLKSSSLIRLRKIAYDKVRTKHNDDLELVIAAKINYAYALALHGDVNDNYVALKLVKNIDVMKAHVFRGCLSAAAFVYYKCAKLSKSKQERIDLLNQSEVLVRKAKKAVRWGTPFIKSQKILDTQLEDIKKLRARYRL